MAVTVAGKNYTLINDCESLTGWSGLTDGLVTDFFKEGAQCIGMELWGAGTNDHTLTGSWDLSGIKHLRLWWMTTVLNELDTDANGGFQIGVSDGTNTGFWLVSGSTTYPGGWYNPVIDLSRAVDSGIKPTMTAITSIILRWELTTGAKKVQSCWIDHLSICDGLIAYGDDAGGYFDFDDIFLADDATTLGIGILRKISGQYFSTGAIEIGDSAGVNGCKFQAKSQVFVFEDRPVASTLYGFDVVDNGTGTTEFILGSKVGTSGIQGCVVRTALEAQTPKFYIDGVTDTDVDNFKMYGSVFFDAGTISFGKAAATSEVIGCSFESCLQVIPGTCKTRNCFFINTSDADAALLWNGSIDIQECSFAANTIGAAIEHPAAGTFGYTDMTFGGNTFDILNGANAVLVDSYQPTEDGNENIGDGAGAITRISQQFTGTAGTLSRAIFSLRKVLAPTGNIVTKLYANSGGQPTGAALATSENVDITGLTTSFADVGFEFEDEYTLVAATEYHISVEYSAGDATNYLEIEYLTAGDGGEACNTYIAAWSTQTYDCRFQVNRDGIVKLTLVDSDPTTEEYSGSPIGATIMPISVNFTLSNVVISPNSMVYVEAEAGGVLNDGDVIVAPELITVTPWVKGLVYLGSQPFRALVTNASSTPLYKPVAFSGTIGANGFSRRLDQIQD